MSNKKKEKFDVGKIKWLVYTVGLVIALSAVVFTFESFGYYEEPEKQEDKQTDPDPFIEEEMPITEIQEQTPPEVVPPKAVVTYPIIQEVPDEKNIEEMENPIDEDNDNENTQGETDNTNTDVGPPPPPSKKTKSRGETKNDVEKIWEIAEVQPQYPGGRKAFAKFLRKNLKYPNQARRLNVQGKVYLSFIIDKSGTISDIKVVKGLKGGCDKEAVRVLKKSPKWKPAKQKGRKVKFKMTLPIVFKLKGRH